ncbi:MAG: sugar ABC transporter permease [Clostridiaceae bacterium]|nr:sugar ABC transporter permease [Clostridiaceae bacterium]
MGAALSKPAKIKPAKIKPAKPKRRQNSFIKEMGTNWTLYLMALPGIAFFFVFNYLPMGGIIMAFKDFNYRDGIWGSPFVGFSNFRLFFRSAAFPVVIYNTLFLNALGIIIGIIIPLYLALALNEVRHRLIRRVSQSVMIFPNFISAVAVSVIVYNIFSYKFGVANQIRELLGLAPRDWYTNSLEWVMYYLIVRTWKGAGYSSIIYLAAITGVSPELYESAEIDGANRVQQIWYITLPSIKSIIIILFILSVGRIFTTDAGFIWLLIGDRTNLLQYMDTIDTYVFRMVRGSPHVGRTTAIGLLQSVSCLITVLMANLVTRKIYPEGAIF